MRCEVCGKSADKISVPAAHEYEIYLCREHHRQLDDYLLSLDIYAKYCNVDNQADYTMEHGNFSGCDYYAELMRRLLDISNEIRKLVQNWIVNNQQHMSENPLLTFVKNASNEENWSQEAGNLQWIGKRNLLHWAKEILQHESQTN